MDAIFTSIEGGTGKTLPYVFLDKSLSKMANKVLVIDLDMDNSFSYIFSPEEIKASPKEAHNG